MIGAYVMERREGEPSMASFGLTLANRGVIIGAVTVPELFEMAKRGEDSGAFDAVWVGDSLLAKPRLESITLLSALAVVTKKVRLAVGCMATFPQRHPALLAQQWASLDVISAGRAWLAVCLGGPNEQSPAQALEHRVMGIKDTERVGRLEEGITILRKLFHEEKASHKGRYYEFEGVTIQPRPVQNPPVLPGRTAPARRRPRWNAVYDVWQSSPTAG